jgi:hypothetical protein
MNMRRQIAILTVIVALALLVVPAYAATIRIDPYSTGYPNAVMLTSPATFNISDVSKTDYDPHIFLVMTNASYDGLSGDVTVAWTGGSIVFHKADFTYAAKAVTTKIPPGVTADYTVASCADHLGISGAPGVYYAFGQFLTNPISSTKQEFTVTASSTALRMLVYAIGRKDSPTADLNNNVPHTQPGLVVPEPAIVLLMLAPFAALGTYAIKRRKP